ncbi:DUF6328 family protein [Streptomyces sp. NPDC050428]|uniref:DUF6328 family protein n=1 Tax=Streptomyces sp. NPDC050428 TaxID=3155757 RepID=UPI00341778C4
MRDHETHEDDAGHHGFPGRDRPEVRNWGRGTETPEERADRRWGDLLQELRVAQTGVQILFGFLLTVVFQQRFTELSDTDRHIYTVTVVLGAATVGTLVGPVSLHRFLTGRRLKPETVLLASRLTILGLFLLLCTMTSSLLLILRLAVQDSWAAGLVGAMAFWFAVCWFGVPLWASHRGNPAEDD